MVRPISVGYPSRIVKMRLWEGTEDEETFEVRCLKRGNPYVLAYGVKYYLTSKEIQLAKSMARLYGEV